MSLATSSNLGKGDFLTGGFLAVAVGVAGLGAVWAVSGQTQNAAKSASASAVDARWIEIMVPPLWGAGKRDRAVPSL